MEIYIVYLQHPWTTSKSLLCKTVKYSICFWKWEIYIYTLHFWEEFVALRYAYNWHKGGVNWIQDWQNVINHGPKIWEEYCYNVWLLIILGNQISFFISKVSWGSKYLSEPSLWITNVIIIINWLFHFWGFIPQYSKVREEKIFTTHPGVCMNIFMAVQSVFGVSFSSN